MKLSGLHLLTTYQCNLRCDHCFVWGSPYQDGVMTLAVMRKICTDAARNGIGSIYFEGGESFLYQPVLVQAARWAFEQGLTVGIVTNGYWATDVQDAVEWLRPLAGKIRGLSISSDTFHNGDSDDRLAVNAGEAAAGLGISTGVISIAAPGEATGVRGQLPEGFSAVMYRGRAAKLLAPKAPQYAWDTFDSCPHENLEDPGRVHVDPFGNLHVCQGISIGNMLATHLEDIGSRYDPRAHPVIGPLLEGGPAEMSRAEGLHPGETYADACHFCYDLRLRLRAKYPDLLGPDQMYGAPGEA